MTRKDFIKNALALGIGFPFLSTFLLESCSKDDSIFPTFKTNFSGKVIIVGAGAAGLAAGYLLSRYGVEFEIIEASPVFGGRVKRIDGFADFPIDIGAEWIHVDPSILADIINNPDEKANIDIIIYNPQSIKSWNNGKLKAHNYVSHFYSEWKFKNTTWHSYFEQYILPHVKSQIVYNKPIVEIDYSGERVVLKTANNETYEADKVLVTAPVKILQNQLIDFRPMLPASKTDAINRIYMGDGIKIFVEFKERFYPDILGFGTVIQAMSGDEKFIYDASFGKDTTKHILALFAINDKATLYTQLATEAEIINKFIAELDEIFDGKASKNYVKHVIQNWSAEPYIQGAYSYTFDGSQRDIVAEVKKPLLDKVFFAGEALSIKNQATVHGACESAYEVIEHMLINQG